MKKKYIVMLFCLKLRQEMIDNAGYNELIYGESGVIKQCSKSTFTDNYATI